MAVEEHRITLDGLPVYYRAAPSPGVQTLYLHTAPTSSDDWTELLARTGGIAPDLIGFGRSAKGGHLDYSVTGLAAFVGSLRSHLGLSRVRLVGHGWGGAVAALAAAADPATVERLVLIDPAPALQPDRWHLWARLWRTPVIGELTMGSTGRLLLARMLRTAAADGDSWPSPRVQQIWDQFDQGTQRATLRLHRSADAAASHELAQALSVLTIPCLLLWGDCDPWFPPALAEEWLAHLPEATLERVPQAGHWPWLDDPALVERIAAFLAES